MTASAAGKTKTRSQRNDMKCRNCGFILRRGQTVCPACGQKNEASSGRAEVNRFVLPIVLGALVVLMAVIVVISVRGKLSARKAGMDFPIMSRLTQ